MKKAFDEYVRESKYVVFDGAMGTQLQQKSLLTNDAPPELLNATEPAAITGIHKTYISAGATLIEANTFGANRLKLEAFGLQERVAELVKAGVKCAQQAAGESAYVALSVGPTGKLLEPLGDLSFDDAFAVFKEQMDAGIAAGADAVIIETMSDFQEVKAAVLAAKRAGAKSIMVSMTFEPDGRTITGINALSANAWLQSLGLTAYGSNCSTGPELLLKNVVSVMTAQGTGPFIFFPNAGMPRLENGRTVYDLDPSVFADFAVKAVGSGTKIIGGCCGTGPEHIKAIADALSALEINTSQRKIYKSMLSSRTETIILADKPFTVIGERINPNARKAIKAAVTENSMGPIRKEALAQIRAGADMLDVNISIPSIDEPAMMKRAVFNIQNIVDIPLCIDSPNTEALESGLKSFAGRALINSVNAKNENMETVLSLATEYGAAVIALPLDERGIPQTAEERFVLAKKIVDKAVEFGLRPSDIFVDGLTLTVSSNPESTIETLNTLARVKKELKANTVLGLSNISFGLPQRSIINKTFLAMAIGYGLDAAIINPSLPDLHGIIDASAVLLNKDKGAKNFIRTYSNAPAAAVEQGTKTVDADIPVDKQIYNAVLTGDSEIIQDLVSEGLKTFEPMIMTNDILIPAIREVGDLYDKGTYFLPQLIMAGDAMHKAFDIIRPLLSGAPQEHNEKVILATVEGDIHDIGKNIVGVMLENYGFDVIDLGKNVPTDKILEAAIENKVKIVGLSALMTTTMPNMQKFIEQKTEKYPELLVAIGGAAVSQSYADEIGADGYAADAVSAAKLFKGLLSK